MTRRTSQGLLEPMCARKTLKFIMLNNLLLVMFVTCCCSGCSGAGKGHERQPVYKVTGVLTRKGEPVEGALIRLLPMGGERPGAVATTDPEGKFELTTYEKGDGACEGDYVILITKEQVSMSSVSSGSEEAADYVPPDDVGPPRAPKNLLPAKYANPALSGLRARIERQGPNHLEIDLPD